MNALGQCYKWFPVEYIGSKEMVWFGKTILNASQTLYESVRKTYPDCEILRYISSCTTAKPETVDPLAYEDYFDFKYVSQNPDWFMLKDSTKPSQEDNWVLYPGAVGRYWLDVSNVRFQQWAVIEIIRKLEIDRLHPQYNFSGVAFDNVVFGKFATEIFGTKGDAFCVGMLNYLKVVYEALLAKDYSFVINPTLQPLLSADDAQWSKLTDCDVVLVENESSKVSKAKMLALTKVKNLTTKPIWLFTFGNTYNDYLSHCGLTGLVKPALDTFRCYDENLEKEIV